MGTITEKQKITQRLNFIDTAEKIQRIVAEYYENGNQSKCKSAVFRNVVTKTYPMSVTTFWRYMRVDVEKERAKLLKEKENLQ